MSRILKVLNQLEQAKPTRTAVADPDQTRSLADPGGVQGLARQRFRQRSFLWSLIAAIVAITLVCALHFTRRPHGLPNMVVKEKSPALVFKNPTAVAERTGVEEPGDFSPGEVGEVVEYEKVFRLFDRPSELPPSDPQPAKIDFSALERVGRQKIRLQAIVWSPKVAERKAVINEEIVWEGEVVEEFTIVAINIDEVILGRQGRLFRAILGQ